jgi:hypothetical protein
MRFQCPTCGLSFTELQCQKLLSKGTSPLPVKWPHGSVSDMKFVCSNCSTGPARTIMADASITLVRVDNRQSIAALRHMRDKYVVRHRN